MKITYYKDKKFLPTGKKIVWN